MRNSMLFPHLTLFGSSRPSVFSFKSRDFSSQSLKKKTNYLELDKNFFQYRIQDIFSAHFNSCFNEKFFDTAAV
jgi:hypothetical protein